jgi:hypothetical protein
MAQKTDAELIEELKAGERLTADKMKDIIDSKLNIDNATPAQDLQSVLDIGNYSETGFEVFTTNGNQNGELKVAPEAVEIHGHKLDDAGNEVQCGKLVASNGTIELDVHNCQTGQDINSLIMTEDGVQVEVAEGNLFTYDRGDDAGAQEVITKFNKNGETQFDTGAETQAYYKTKIDGNGVNVDHEGDEYAGQMTLYSHGVAGQWNWAGSGDPSLITFGCEGDSQTLVLNMDLPVSDTDNEYFTMEIGEDTQVVDMSDGVRVAWQDALGCVQDLQSVLDNGNTATDLIKIVNDEDDDTYFIIDSNNIGFFNDSTNEFGIGLSDTMGVVQKGTNQGSRTTVEMTDDLITLNKFDDDNTLLNEVSVNTNGAFYNGNEIITTQQNDITVEFDTTDGSTRASKLSAKNVEFDRTFTNDPDFGSHDYASTLASYACIIGRDNPNFGSDNDLAGFLYRSTAQTANPLSLHMRSGASTGDAKKDEFTIDMYHDGYSGVEATPVVDVTMTDRVKTAFRNALDISNEDSLQELFDESRNGIVWDDNGEDIDEHDREILISYHNESPSGVVHEYNCQTDPTGTLITRDGRDGDNSGSWGGITYNFQDDGEVILSLKMSTEVDNQDPETQDWFVVEMFNEPDQDPATAVEMSPRIASDFRDALGISEIAYNFLTSLDDEKIQKLNDLLT